MRGIYLAIAAGIAASIAAGAGAVITARSAGIARRKLAVGTAPFEETNFGDGGGCPYVPDYVPPRTEPTGRGVNYTI